MLQDVEKDVKKPQNMQELILTNTRGSCFLLFTTILSDIKCIRSQDFPITQH